MAMRIIIDSIQLSQNAVILRAVKSEASGMRQLAGTKTMCVIYAAAVIATRIRLWITETWLCAA